MNRSKILKKADLAVYTPNLGQTPVDYAIAQMKGRGTAFAVGPFKDTGSKLVAAESVNGIAFVTLSRVNLTDAEKADVKGWQIVAYDLAGAILHCTPLDDTAPKGNNRGYAVFGEVKKAIASRNDLVIAAIQGKRDTLKRRVEELDELLAELAPASEGESEEQEEQAAEA